MSQKRRNVEGALLGTLMNEGNKHLKVEATSGQAEVGKLVTCPVCSVKLRLGFMNSHLDECTGENSAKFEKPAVQKSLNSFLNLPDYSLPNYFFLEKRDNEFLARFHRSKPPEVKFTFRSEVSWAGSKLVVCTDVTAGVLPKLRRPDSDSVPFCQRNLPLETRYRNLPFIKSHLQKCIRRQDAARAIKTAVHFIKMDLMGFLRRITIIALEDVCMQSEYLVAVWLLAACSKGFLISGELLEFLLGYVQGLCQMDYKDSAISFEDPSLHPSLPSFTAASELVWSLSLEERSWVFALKLRKSFGGLKGDQNLLENLSRHWADRFSRKLDSVECYEPFQRFKCNPISPQKVQPLQLQEWQLAALDFHVCDIVRRIIAGYEHIATLSQPRLAPISEPIVQSILWNCSSGLNKREIHQIYAFSSDGKLSLYRKTDCLPKRSTESVEAEKLEPIWKVVKPIFEASALEILRQKS